LFSTRQQYFACCYRTRLYFACCYRTRLYFACCYRTRLYFSVRTLRHHFQGRPRGIYGGRSCNEIDLPSAFFGVHCRNHTTKAPALITIQRSTTPYDVSRWVRLHTEQRPSDVTPIHVCSSYLHEVTFRLIYLVKHSNEG